MSRLSNYKIHSSRTSTPGAMPSAALMTYSQRLAVRAEAFLQQDRILRSKQRLVHEDVVAALRSDKPFGSIRRPTGTGKTFNQVALALAANMDPESGRFNWDTKVLYLTPRCFLANDILEKTFRKSFNIPSSAVGIYHSKIDRAERQAALQKPILITTPQSWNKLLDARTVNVHERPLIHIDEVHLYKGPVIKPRIKEAIKECVVLGWTATDRFISGETVADVLFDGRDPIHVTTFGQAVKDEELCAVKNIILETGLHTGVRAASLSGQGMDYTDFERALIANKSGRDEMALDVLFNYVDPETGIRFRDLSSVIYCSGVPHAHRVAQKINKAACQSNFARAVSGDTDWRELQRILADFQTGKIRVLTCADLLIHGFDAPRAQLCIMLRPTRSPIIAEQTGGRIMRLNPECPEKLAFILTLVDKGLTELKIFGECAGGMEFLTPGRTIYGCPPPIEINEVSVYYNFPPGENKRKLLTTSDEIDHFFQKITDERVKVEKLKLHPGLNSFGNPGATSVRLEMPLSDSEVLHRKLELAKKTTSDEESYLKIEFNEKEICLPREAVLLPEGERSETLILRKYYQALMDQLGITSGYKVPYAKPIGWKVLANLGEEIDVSQGLVFARAFEKLESELTATRRYPFIIPDTFDFLGLQINKGDIGHFRIKGYVTLCLAGEVYSKIVELLSDPWARYADPHADSSSTPTNSSFQPLNNEPTEFLSPQVVAELFRNIYRKYCDPLIKEHLEYFPDQDYVSVIERSQLKLVSLIRSELSEELADSTGDNTLSLGVEEKVLREIGRVVWADSHNCEIPPVKQLFTCSITILNDLCRQIDYSRCEKMRLALSNEPNLQKIFEDYFINLRTGLNDSRDTQLFGQFMSKVMQFMA